MQKWFRFHRMSRTLFDIHARSEMCLVVIVAAHQFVSTINFTGADFHFALFETMKIATRSVEQRNKIWSIQRTQFTLCQTSSVIIEIFAYISCSLRRRRTINTITGHANLSKWIHLNRKSVHHHTCTPYIPWKFSYEQNSVNFILYQCKIYNSEGTPNTSWWARAFMFFCVQFAASWFHKCQKGTQSSKEKRFDTCKFNNGPNCWITCIDIRLTCAPSTQHHHHSKMACIYLFIFILSFTGDISRKSFRLLFVWDLLMDIEIFPAWQTWMVHYNKPPLNCKVYQHWIDNQTHWICHMFCHWKAHTHIMACEQTNMQHIQSWDTSPETTMATSRDADENKEKESENNSKK